MPPTDVVEDDTDIGVMCTDVFGPEWKKLRIAHLATADRVGFELFEFDGNYAPENNIDFRQNGTFHFCVQDPDVRRSGRKQLWQLAVSNGCRSDSIIPERSPTAWSTLKTHLVLSSKFTAILMN